MYLQTKLSVDGIQDIIDAIEKSTNDLESKIDRAVDKLSEMAREDAQQNFNGAISTNINDNVVTVENIGKCSRNIVAKGHSVWFVEFGTGVRYPSGHPEPHPEIFDTTTYGLGKGKNPNGWVYRIDSNMGLGDTMVSKTVKNNVAHTKGYPANACLYHARENARGMLEDVVKGELLK